MKVLRQDVKLEALKPEVRLTFKPPLGRPPYYIKGPGPARALWLKFLFVLRLFRCSRAWAWDREQQARREYHVPGEMHSPWAPNWYIRQWNEFACRLGKFRVETGGRDDKAEQPNPARVDHDSQK